jgi:cell division protein FtsL
MNIKLMIRIIISLIVCTTSIFSYISLQNKVTCLKIKIPKIEKQLISINDEISHLQYEIDQFESPDRLMDLACHPDFIHLKHPYIKDIETIQVGYVVSLKNIEKISSNKGILPIGSR